MKIDYSTGKDITPEEYHALAETQGWGEDRSPDRNAKAIEGSIFIASARHDGKLAGLLRLIGDGAYCLHIADFIVHDEYQGKGIGTELLNMSLEYAREQGIGTGENIGEFTLFSTLEGEKLYKKCGFLPVANGMVLAYSEKRRMAEVLENREWIKSHPDDYSGKN